ncbi:Bicoid-interacting protein 3-domain-containing protein [Absidia repens]|uniref:RNA methyltransferase n=1 Tax=Absidia repens TaxID=90262 RepID=A0A1X2ICJ9_9FUNG|nr:Bicoid-interacting protein 3-domain-containing protein [Absidia repens]
MKHKRYNPYLEDSTPLNKRTHISLGNETRSTTSHHDDTHDATPLLGGKTGTFFHPPSDQPSPAVTRGSYLYGNYANYYASRRNDSTHQDTRLALLDNSLFMDKIVLDIGCNSGNVTIAIGQNCKPKEILGVDIDEHLIVKANIQKRTTYSLQKPPQENTTPTDSATTTPLSAVDIRLQSHYFPQSMARIHGQIPVNVPPSYGSGIFPFNISFEAGDWLTMDIKEQHYDTILALSITKWIHLHRGDQGIKAFFQRIYQSLKKGGVFILEPQLFTTYERRTKSSKEMSKVFESIKFKPEDFHDYLMGDIGFSDHRQLGTPANDSKGFSRPLHLYIK